VPRWASGSSDAADGPGFLVNRCSRPFGLEALRLVQDGVADVEVVDRVCRLGGAFPMGRSSSRTSSASTSARGGALVLRAELRRAALAPVAAERAHGRRGAARPQGRPWLVRVPRAADADPAPPAAGGGDGRTVRRDRRVAARARPARSRGRRGLRRARVPPARRRRGSRSSTCGAELGRAAAAGPRAGGAARAPTARSWRSRLGRRGGRCSTSLGPARTPSGLVE
jgi:hypothetical protein